MLELAQALLLGAAQPGATAAEAAPPAIVVTGSRTEAAAVPGAIRVERDAFERLQPASLLEVLDDLAGVRAFSTGGIGGGAYLSVRGGEPNFTLVAIEGLKLNNPMNSRGGAFDFALIDPALVDSVEVVRGAGSAIHGSDALSGLVAIRLRAPVAGGTAGGARLLAGSQGETGIGARAEHGWRSGALLFAGAWFDSGGLDVGSDLERVQALARIRQRLGGFEARALGLHARTERAVFPEDSGGPLLAVTRERERSQAELAAGIVALRREPAATLRPNLSLSWSDQRDDGDTPAIAPGALDGVPALSARNRFERVEAIADLGIALGRVSATLGGALLRESGRSRGTIDIGSLLPVGFDLTRTTRSAFAEASFRPSRAASINFAARMDDVAHGPRSWTGRVAIRLQPRPGGPTFSASIGEGYKLPSFFALAHPLIGNPDLRPERSVNAEAGVEWPIAGGTLRLTLFRNRFRDLVDFDPELFRNVNRSRVETQGVELEGDIAVSPRLDFSGALTLLDLDSPTPLRGRPRWQGAARGLWRASPRLEISAAVRANSAFFDSSIPTGLVRSDGHVEADLGLRYWLTPSLRLDAALRNLTGSRHQQAVGFPAPGRVLRATLSAGF